MVSVYTEVEVDVDLSDFDTEDILEELASRSSLPTEADNNAKDLIEAIWLKRRLGNNDYQEEIDKLIYTVLGKVI